MKKYIYILSLVLLASSCVKDLDTLPLNATDPISEYVYGTDEDAYVSGLARLYFQFATNDLTDLQNMDGGASEIVRAFWSVQETTTDEANVPGAMTPGSVHSTPIHGLMPRTMQSMPSMCVRCRGYPM